MKYLKKLNVYFIHKFSILLVFAWLSSIDIADAQSYLKENTQTVEKIGDLIRRKLVYDGDLNIIKEDYYSNSTQKIIVTIEYNYENPSLISALTGYTNYPDIAYSIDFDKGIYIDTEDEIELRFKDNFNFNGYQKGKNILGYYVNNKKQNKIIQADSVAIGKAIIINNDTVKKYVKTDLVRFYNTLTDRSEYVIYNGVILNFDEGKLNGEQKLYNNNGIKGFESYYSYNKLIRYTSYSTDNSIISKLKTSNGITQTNQILNGTLLNKEQSYVYWYHALHEAGDILFDSSFSDFNNGSYYLRSNKFAYDKGDIRQYMNLNSFKRDKPYNTEYKQKFDSDMYTFSNPYVIKYLLNIPDFYIKKYNYIKQEDKSIIAINTSKNNDTLNIFDTSMLSLSEDFYFIFNNINYYSFKTSWNVYLLLFPYDYEMSKYDPVSIQQKDPNEYTALNLNEKLAKYIITTFGINNIFYLSPKIANDGESMEYVVPSFAYDSLSIRRFLGTYVDIMLRNIKTICLNKSNFVNSQLLSNPFIGVFAGYASDKNFESQYRYFNFDILGDNNIIIKNYSDERYFKIYNKYYSEYFDGSCLYKFNFKEGNWGVFLVDKVNVDCR